MGKGKLSKSVGQKLHTQFKKTEDSLNLKETISRYSEIQDIDLRRGAIIFLFWAYGLLLFLTMSIFFLQGFKVFGFNLSDTTLNWLGGATIGEIGGLAVMVYQSLLKKPKGE